MARPMGWRKEPARHSLAAKGIKTNKRVPRSVAAKILPTNPFDALWKYRDLDWGEYNKRDRTFQFSNVPPSVVREWMERTPSFVDPEDQQNTSPYLREMIEIAEKYNGTLHGYAISPESGRHDARISLEGFVLNTDELTALRIQKDVRADEFEKIKGGWRFWWD